jgi:low affinity Fe/Cu permease
MNELFRRFASATSYALGSPWAFAMALLVVLVWLAVGPAMHYSDHWQLLINTGTTILTFLMVFLIQNTQNRDAKAINLKLDELLRAVEGARTGLVDLESLSDAELLALQEELVKLAKREGLPSIRERRAVRAPAGKAKKATSRASDSEAA